MAHPARPTGFSEVLAALKPAHKDQDYYIRLATGLLFVAFFFALAAIVSQKEFSDYEGFVGQEGNTFFYSERNAIAGSLGQSIVAAVFSGVALLVALATILRRWRMGLVVGTKVFLQVFVITGITGALAGLMGNGVVQLGLSAVGLRVELYWLLLPILAVGAVYGVLSYAAQGRGTVLDL